MADNKDKPNRPFIPDDPGFESLKRIGRRYSNPTAEDLAERQKLQAASERINGLEQFIEDNPDLANATSITGGIQDARETINRYSPRVSQRRESRRERAIRETTSSVEREFSPRSVNGQVSGMMSESAIQSRGLAMSGMGQRELEEQRGSVVGEIGQLEKRATNMIENDLYDREGRQSPEVMQNIQGLYRSKRALTGKIATINTSLKKQRQEGTDEESKDESLLKTGRNARDILFRQQVSAEMQSGQGVGGLSNDQLKQKEAEQANALVEALERLKNAAGESAETIDKLKENAHDAAGSLKKTQEAIRQGGGGSGEGGRNPLANIPGIASTVANAAREVLIAQPLQALGNRTGFAALSNTMYDTRKAAIGGDMTSLLNASKEMTDRMAAVGNNFKVDAQLVRGISTVGSAAQMAVGAGLGGQGFLTGNDAGIKNVVEGAAGTAVNAGDLINNASATSANLAGQQSMYGMNTEVNKVRGDFLQSFYDYSQGTRGAALAAGGRGGQRILGQFASDRGGQGGMLGRMQNARMSPEEFARLSGEAALEQGSVFNTDQVFQSRKLEQAGVGTKEMNMQRMGALAAAGSNNPQAAFASVLEVAFSKSLDSSKALNMVVQNTAEMAKTSLGATALGMDTTGAAANRIGTLVNMNNPNREMAVQRATTAAERINDINTSIGANFTDMLGISRIAKAGGTDTVTAMALKSLDDPTANALRDKLKRYQSMDPNEKKRLGSDLSEAGLGGFVDVNGNVKATSAVAAFNVRSQSTVMKGVVSGMLDPNTPGYKELMSGSLSNEDLNKPEYKTLKDQLGKMRLATGLTASETAASVNAGPAANAEGKTATNTALAGTGGGATLKAMDQSATAMSTEMANKARQAASELGGAAAALTKVNAQMQKLVGQLNDKTAGEFQNAAAESARDFRVGADHFVTAVGDFGKSVALLKGVPTNASDAVKKQLQDASDAISHRGSKKNSASTAH